MNSLTAVENDIPIPSEQTVAELKVNSPYRRPTSSSIVLLCRTAIVVGRCVWILIIVKIDKIKEPMLHSC